MLNHNSFNTSTYHDPSAKQQVKYQENGHTFGHRHQHGRQATSCMNDGFQYLFNAAYEYPNQHDYDELGVIYAHLDDSSTIGASARGPSNAAAANAADWGPPAESQGRELVFEKDLGGGHKLVTWVLVENPNIPPRP